MSSSNDHHEYLLSICEKMDKDYEPYGKTLRDSGDCSCGCRFYYLLEDIDDQAISMDWGVCTNPKSHRCGKLTFEHQGCMEFENDPADLAEEDQEVEDVEAVDYSRFISMANYVVPDDVDFSDTPDLEDKMNEPVALIDMDGTLCDYAGAMKYWLKKTAMPGEEIPEDFAGDVPDHIKVRQDIIKRQPGWWETLEFTDFGKMIVEELRKLDYQLHVLTKGPASTEHSWMEKVVWCRTHLQDAGITITEDKGLVYGRLLVDDYPDYIIRWLEWRPRGLVIMPAQHYNEWFKHPNVLRYRGEEDKEELIKRLTEARKRN